ncbi:hypothetical protein D3C80_1840330 [compost metagenome]
MLNGHNVVQNKPSSIIHDKRLIFNIVQVDATQQGKMTQALHHFHDQELFLLIVQCLFFLLSTAMREELLTELIIELRDELE